MSIRYQYRPWTGPLTDLGGQVAITGRVTGGIILTNAYIVGRKNTNTMYISNGSNSGEVTLVNTLSPGNLSDGEAFISATPYLGIAKAVKNISTTLVETFDTVDDAGSTISRYKWNGGPALNENMATVVQPAQWPGIRARGVITITSGDLSDAVVDIRINGRGYSSVPNVTLLAPSGGADAIFTANVSNGSVTGVTISGSPTGYPAGKYRLRFDRPS